VLTARRVISIGYYISNLGSGGIVTKPRNQKGTEHPIAPLLAYQADPIRESVKRLGRKWTLLILRDMAFLELDRFGKILRNDAGRSVRPQLPGPEDVPACTSVYWSRLLPPLLSDP